MYNIGYSVEEKLLVLPRLMNINRNIKRGFQLRDMIAVCAKRDPLSHNIKNFFVAFAVVNLFFVLIFLKKSRTHTCAHTHKIKVKIMILINKYK